MRQFNFVVMLMALVLANSASASESKHEANKHKQFSNIFVPASKDFTFKYADLLNHKAEMSHDLPSPSSFQFKAESGFDWFGKSRHNSHDNGHENSLIAGDDRANEGRGRHEDRWDREHHGENLHHGNGHHGGYDWDNSDHWGQGDIGDYCNVPTQPVPEPETYAMLLAGLFTIGALKRRKAAH